MQNRQRAPQTINIAPQVKHKTLPQTMDESSCQSQQLSRQNDISVNSTERTGFKLKFNTSYDNLRCFISENKPQRYRSVSTRLSKQSKSQICLSNTKSHFRYSKEDHLIEPSKSETQKNESIKIKQLQDDDEQKDLSHILSNQIIHSIQRKGIGYDWNDIQQIKSQEFLSQNKNQQKQLEEIFDAFSDPTINKRLSFQSKSDKKSLLLQNIFQNDQLIQEDIQSYQYFDTKSGYNMGFDKNYSFASTMQPYSNIYYPINVYIENDVQTTTRLTSMPSSMFQSYQFIIRPEGLGKDPRTTLMIKNIPNKYTIHFLSQQIDLCFGNSYDFLYLPCDTKSGANQGYGFINFIDLEALQKFYQKIHGKKWKRFKSQKICNLTYARLQGINSLIEHFQNSKVLNHKEKKYQPIIKSLSEIHHLIKKQQISQQEQN